MVGPEAPLVAGVVDEFRARGQSIVGPDRADARLEGSKVFAKNFLEQTGIPTAGFVTVENPADARRAIDRFGFPVVLKADGLAAGNAGFFLDLSRRGLSVEEAQRQLDIAIDWGRYGELFDYDAKSGQLRLEVALVGEDGEPRAPGA